ncbi:hypothetical protein niasHS_011841 [Heterodera schachtii]|uniref:Uncharacterized protein n=1 Tax=Heterodera schachtii TaxID=97005 RepID=A0ABD2IR25_HETSC
MAKRKLISELQNKKAAQKRWDKREERKAQTAKAIQARLAKKNTPQPNPDAETPQQDEAGPSTSAASAGEAMEPPPPTPGPVPTPEMDEELLEFGFSLPSTPATPIGDLVPFPSTPIAPMDIGEMTPPPLVIDDRSERIEQLEMELKNRDDTIQFLREQVRNRDALITALRRQLEQCAPPPTATPTTSKTTPNRGRPRKAIDELQRSSRKRLTEQILDAIDRDRSRSASRGSLERIHREVRHKFGHYTPKKAQPKKGKDEMEANDGLLLMTQLGTQKAYQRMKATLRGFGLIRKCNLVFWLVTLKRRICAPLRYEQIETNGGVGFVCADVRSALESRFCAAKDNLINFGNNIFVKISGDYGQSFTKITVSFFQAVRSNSPSNNFIVAVFPAKDSRENLERFIGGDISFIWSLIGHCGSAVTTFPSPICTCRADQMLHEQCCQHRTIDQTVELAEQYRAALQNGDKATAAVRSASMGITKPPLLRSINFDRIIPAPFHVFQGIGNAIVRELERQEGCAPIAQQFFRRIGARREQFRKRDLTGNSIRKILAQILSPNDLDGLERSIDDFKVFLAEQDRMSAFLSKKPKAHLLLFHFVPFARQHQFIGLLDEQGDEALHSVWRRLEQWWKCMPDAEQILQQLEHHFVNNWLLDTGRIDELKRNYEERKGEDDMDDEAAEEIDDECQIDYFYAGHAHYTFHVQRAVAVARSANTNALLVQNVLQFYGVNFGKNVVRLQHNVRQRIIGLNLGTMEVTNEQTST